MAKSFIGMNGFNPNEYSKFNDGINVYTCITTENNHALTGSGNNIKFIADAPFNDGDTITVNGETVSAQTQDGEPLQGGAWATGATIVCYLEGNILNFKGGGGKVTVTGLSADVVKSGTTVTVKQGAKVVASVTGTATGGIVKYDNVAVNQRNGASRTLSIAGVCPFYTSLTIDEILVAPVNFYDTSGGITVTMSNYDPASSVITLGITGSYNSFPIGYCTVAVVDKG